MLEISTPCNPKPSLEDINDLLMKKANIQSAISDFETAKKAFIRKPPTELLLDSSFRKPPQKFLMPGIFADFIRSQQKTNLTKIQTAHPIAAKSSGKLEVSNISETPAVTYTQNRRIPKKPVPTTAIVLSPSKKRKRTKMNYGEDFKDFLDDYEYE